MEKARKHGTSNPGRALARKEAKSRIRCFCFGIEAKQSNNLRF